MDRGDRSRYGGARRNNLVQAQCTHLMQCKTLALLPNAESEFQLGFEEREGEEDVVSVASLALRLGC